MLERWPRSACWPARRLACDAATAYARTGRHAVQGCSFPFLLKQAEERIAQRPKGNFPSWYLAEGPGITRQDVNVALDVSRMCLAV